MKKTIFVLTSLLLVSIPLLNAKSQTSMMNNSRDTPIDYPSVPRISAYEAYVKYKAGKAILIQADTANTYKTKHIMGALNYTSTLVREGRVKLPNLPRKGIEIITFCY